MFFGEDECGARMFGGGDGLAVVPGLRDAVAVRFERVAHQGTNPVKVFDHEHVRACVALVVRHPKTSETPARRKFIREECAGVVGESRSPSDGVDYRTAAGVSTVRYETVGENFRPPRVRRAARRLATRGAAARLGVRPARRRALSCRVRANGSVARSTRTRRLRARGGL